jgi:four helix bundle protein
MNSYKDLDIYTESKRLAIEVHRVSLDFPKFELYEEGSQLRRSSKSITSNIVEGFGRRRYKNDFVRYLVFSLSECDETILHLTFAFETGSFKNEGKFSALSEGYIKLSKKINKFLQWVEKSY